MNERLPVSVVIVNYKTPILVQNALKALFESTHLPEQVILVDNASGDGIEMIIKKDFPSVKLIMNTENLGFARANNDAIKICTGKYIWLLNSDTETGKYALQNLYEYMEKNENVGAISPKLVYPDHSLQSVGGFFPNFFNVLEYLLPIGYLFSETRKKTLKRIALYPQEIAGFLDLDYVTGAACFLRKAALEKVGLLGEEYFMYFEETDLCWRLKRGGWRVRAVETDPVMHIYGGSFKAKRDPKRLVIFLQSLKKFVLKNYPSWKSWPIVFEVNLFGKLSIFLKSKKI